MPGLLFFCPFGVMGVFYYAESFIRQVRVDTRNLDLDLVGFFAGTTTGYDAKFVLK